MQYSPHNPLSEHQLQLQLKAAFPEQPYKLYILFNVLYAFWPIYNNIYSIFSVLFSHTL